jgi:hypothetical protein
MRPEFLDEHVLEVGRQADLWVLGGDGHFHDRRDRVSSAQGVETASAGYSRPSAGGCSASLLGIHRAGRDEHERRNGNGSEMKTHALNFTLWSVQ